MQCSICTNDDLLPPIKTLTVLKDKNNIDILYMQIARIIIPNPVTIIILLLQGGGNFFAWQQMHEPKRNVETTL